jgi:hypothetical protein
VTYQIAPYKHDAGSNLFDFFTLMLCAHLIQKQTITGRNYPKTFWYHRTRTNRGERHIDQAAGLSIHPFIWLASGQRLHEADKLTFRNSEETRQ